MSPELARSRRAVSKAGRATNYLIVVSVLLMTALAAVFVYLAARQNAMRDSIREDALWSVYQLDREVRMLSQAVDRASLSTGDARAAKALGLRYDILYSRLSILDNTKYGAFFSKSPAFISSRRKIRGLVLGMEPVFDAVAKGRLPAPDQLAKIRGTLERLQHVTENLLTFTNASVSAARADTRAQVMQLQQVSVCIVLALGLSIALLILNLMRQFRIVNRASSELEATAMELADAYRAAEAGNRAKSEFMATIGHEIRTPLNAILGMAELLSQSRLAESEMENVRVITSSGTALLEVINEILDFAKIEHGETSRESLPFDPAALVREAVQVMEGRARDQNDRIDLLIDDAVVRTWYLGDPTHLRRVMLNLLSNAVKFTRDGIVRVQLHEVSRGGRPALRFEVADNGIGISEETRHRLFNAFSQVDGTISRRFGGTGLGLAICKKIVEALGGEIGVDSALGVGSCFWFEVPAEHVAASDETSREASGSACELPRLDLLVVEDNQVNQQVARQFLEKLGQRVTIASDGEKAVELVRNRRFDLVLMDMQMPVMDGIAATRAIRALGEGHDVPVVAMTANASDEDRRLCLEAGMNGFELKPVSMARLSNLISLHGRGARAADRVPVQASEAAPDSLAGQDPHRVAELVEAIGEDGFQQLMEAFVGDAAALMRELQAAMAEDDGARRDRALHAMKGAAANLGFAELSALAEDLREAQRSTARMAELSAAMAAIGVDGQAA